MAATEDHPKKVTIIIDKKEYHVESSSLTGSQLRALPDPLIGMDYDLFKIVPGGNDQLIADDRSLRRSGSLTLQAPVDRRLLGPGRRSA